MNRQLKALWDNPRIRKYMRGTREWKEDLQGDNTEGSIPDTDTDGQRETTRHSNEGWIKYS